MGTLHDQQPAVVAPRQAPAAQSRSTTTKSHSHRHKRKAAQSGSYRTARDKMRPATPAAPAAAIQAPSLSGKTLARWQETTGARISGGKELPPPDGAKNGFGSRQEAIAWAGAKVADMGADGGAVVQKAGRYFAYTIKVHSWVYDFTRDNLESGTDKLLPAKGMPAGLDCLVTEDGHAAPLTGRGPGSPTAIVERDERGKGKVSTEISSVKAYQALVKRIDGSQKGKGKGKGKGKAKAPLGRAGYVALFKGMLKAKAMVLIQSNHEQLRKLQAKYAQGADGRTGKKGKKGKKGDETPHWERLRAMAAKDQLLAKHQDRLTSARRSAILQAAFMSRPRGGGMLPMYGGGMRDAQTAAMGRAHKLLQQIKKVKEARATIRKAFPALTVVKSEDVTAGKSNAQVFAHMKGGFAEVHKALDLAQNKIHSEDMPLSKLGAVVDRVKKDMGVSDAAAKAGDPKSAAVLGWLKGEDRTEAFITWTGTILSFTLGIGALIFSGGTAGILLGIGGAAFGFGTAAYEFERADDLHDAGRASAAGGKKLVKDPAAARFNYIMGWVNLVLGGLDLGLAARSASTLLKGQKIAKRMAATVGSDAFAKMKPKHLVKLDKATTLASSGNAKGSKKILDGLRKTLGDDVVDKAARVFAGAKAIEKHFGKGSKLTDAAKQVLGNLDPRSIAKIAKGGDEFAEGFATLLQRTVKDGGGDIATMSKLVGSVGPARFKALTARLNGAAITQLRSQLGPKTFDRLVKQGVDGLTIRTLAGSHSPADIAKMSKSMSAAKITKKVDDAVLSGLEKVTADTRMKYLKNKPIKKGNVASLKATLRDGPPIEKTATSRAKGPIKEAPTPRSKGGNFEPIYANATKRVMNTDSEFKILDALANDLKSRYGAAARNVHGQVHLYTEMSPCESCSRIIRQFERMFPNMKVKVRYTHVFAHAKKAK